MDSMMFKGSVMTSHARILVLYASTYDMLNERQEKVTGCTVRYLFWGEEGEALGEQMEWDPRKPVGVQVAKCSIEIGLREKLPVAPALYDGDFEITTGGDGKPIMRLRNIAYVSNVRIAAHVNQGFMVPGMVSPEMQPVSYKMVREDPSDESPVVNPSLGTSAENIGAVDQASGAPETKADTASAGKQTGKSSK